MYIYLQENNEFLFKTFGLKMTSSNDIFGIRSYKRTCLKCCVTFICLNNITLLVIKSNFTQTKVFKSITIYLALNLYYGSTYT